MKTINLYTLIVFTTALALVSSCKKGGDAPASTGCKITKMNTAKWGMDIISTVTYNSSNQVIEVQENNIGYIKGTLYSYDANGNVSKMEMYEGSSKGIIGKTEYSYDTNGVTEEKIYSNRGSGLEAYTVIRYNYHNKKRIRKDIFTVMAGKETLANYIEYEYGSNGDVSETRYYVHYLTGFWGVYSRQTYSYSDEIKDPYIKRILFDDINFPANHYITKRLEEKYHPGFQTWEVSNTVDYIYSFDAMGNPTVIDVMQGYIIFNLTWNC